MELSPGEFRRSLHAGLGRALRDVRSVPEQERREILLDACLYNRTYDPQLDSDRAAWLCEILESSGDLDDLAPRLLQALPGDATSWDYTQRVHLARELGLRRFREAHEILWRELRSDHPDDFHDHPLEIAVDLVRLEGLAALTDVSKYLGNRIDPGGTPADPSDFDFLTEEVADRFGWAAVEKALRDSASSDPGAAAFLSQVEGRIRRGTKKAAPREFDPRREFWGEFTFEQVRARMERPAPRDPRHTWVMRWGMWTASEKDLDEALSALATETDSARLKCLVAIFARREMPRFEPRFLDLLDDPDVVVSWNAGLALEHFQHDEIRRKGIERLRAGRCDARTMQLLRSNFREEDVPLLWHALPREEARESQGGGVEAGDSGAGRADGADGARVTDDEGIGDIERFHAPALGIREIARTRGSTGLRELLEWAYENAGCRRCRADVVHMLVEAQDASPSMLDECRFDSDPALRQFARTTREHDSGSGSP